jgi:hypothetical protein
MLESFPTQELLVRIRQDLEIAVGPCLCRIGEEPVSVLSMGLCPQETHAVHWTFRNAILVFPSSSAFPRCTLHSPGQETTPGEAEACLKVIHADWPQDVVRATWKRYPSQLGVDSGLDKCPVWGFGGTSSPNTTVCLLYVQPTPHGFQLRQPRALYPPYGGDGPAKYLWDDVISHPDMAYPRSPGDLNTGQVW